MKKFTLFMILISLVGCNDGTKQKSKPTDTSTSEVVKAEKPHPGKLIIQQECYICHDQKTSMANRIAPPMEAIKRHYIDSSRL